MNARMLLPALLAFVVGTAAQLQQVSLFAWQFYASFVLLVPAGWALLAIKTRASIGRSGRPSLGSKLPVWLLGALVCLGALCLGFGAAGWRSSVFLDDALAPALEGQDIAVTGVVAAMPQRNEAGLRFRLDVESARSNSGPVTLPPHLYLGWYAGAYGVWTGSAASAANPVFELQRQPGDLSAGERWQMTVRLKAPHGGSNPFGFDYELWLWEQGLQATGYVRAGPKDTTPQRIGATWQHPVEGLRQKVRDAIFARVASPKLAGVIAALVVGDQNAIDRWGQTLKSLSEFPSERVNSRGSSKQ